MWLLKFVLFCTYVYGVFLDTFFHTCPNRGLRGLITNLKFQATHYTGLFYIVDRPVRTLEAQQQMRILSSQFCIERFRKFRTIVLASSWFICKQKNKRIFLFTFHETFLYWSIKFGTAWKSYQNVLRLFHPSWSPKWNILYRIFCFYDKKNASILYLQVYKGWTLGVYIWILMLYNLPHPYYVFFRAW